MISRNPAATKERWQRLNEIFAAVVDIAPEYQADFLTHACGSDEALQREVEAILAGTRHADRQGFLHGDAFAYAAPVLVANEISPGTIIGPYRVMREIGRGGMGAVYLASREGFHQQVALKIIKRGMDTDAIIRRFVQERDVLASLNHPNIARLLDGGTTDGLPFISMEYVEGKSITDYCDEKRLTIDERLGLFRKVCAAVEYAHQNLVVHRDIKPSNILIAPDGEPKLLDFGIAKLLSPDLFGTTIEPTAAGANLLTPEYASPEQIRGDKITTASDVYSLGVLLYELLSGHRPFRFKSRLAGDVLQVISEQQPPSPSTAASTKEEIELPPEETKRIVSPDSVAEMRSEKPSRLQRKLAGDLDNIVLMALRKEPERRYKSVEQFAEDLSRHLQGRPVAARPATFSYRTTKFIERNQVATGFATLALLAILGGCSIAAWQAIVARQQSARAERRANEVRQLAKTLLKDLKSEVEVLPGSDEVARKINNVSIQYLEGLAKETGDPTVRHELSEAYVLLGKQYGYETGNEEVVRQNIGRGLEMSRRLAAEAPNDLEAKRLLAKNLEEYDYFCEKDPAEKVRLNQERARLREDVVAALPNDAEGFAELGQAHNTLKYLSYLYEHPDEALRYSRLALNAWEHQVGLLETSSPTKNTLDALSLVYLRLGQVYLEEFKDSKTSEDYYKRALAVAETLRAEHPEYRFSWVRLAAAHRSIADKRHDQGDYESALSHYRTCLRLVNEADLQFPQGPLRGAEPGYMLRVAENLYRTRKTDEALLMLRAALAANQHVNHLGVSEWLIASRDAWFLRLIGETYMVFGRTSDALAAYDEAEQILKKVSRLDSQQQSEANMQMAEILLDRGDLYSATKADLPEARHQYQETVDILSKLKTENEIGLDGLKALVTAQHKLQALSD